LALSKKVKDLEKVPTQAVTKRQELENQFILAKLYPRTTPSTPFMINDQPASVKSGKVQTTFRVTQVPNYDTAIVEPLGTRKYVIIAYCPSLTWSYGRAPMPSTTKLSGLMMAQTDNLLTSIGIGAFTTPNYALGMS